MSWPGMDLGGGGDVLAQPVLLVLLMALTEAGLWPYRGELGSRQSVSGH